MKKIYIDKIRRWEGTSIDLCYELFELLDQSEDKLADFKLLCEKFDYYNSKDKEYYYYSDDELELLKRTYAEYIDGCIRTCMMSTYNKNESVNSFYKLLWKMVFSSEILCTQNEKSFALYWILIDKQIPFQNVNDAIKMSFDVFKKASMRLKNRIRRIDYIIKFPFDQKTEVSSLIIKEIHKCKSIEDQSIVLAFALDKYAEENPPKQEKIKNN